MMIRIGNAVAAVLETLAAVCTEGARRLKRCPDCGQNKFYGKSCPNLGSDR